MYKIKCNDDYNFDLYEDDKFICFAKWVGNHLLTIAQKHNIDISNCQSESHALSVIQECVSVKVDLF